MAEHGANLSSSRLAESSKPSVFEVLAQESLSNTIRPAVKHAVKVFAEKYPARLGALLRFYDEIFLAVDAVVQNHFLKTWSASFAENFYSLQRVASGATPRKTQLDRNLTLRSLGCLVLIPYLRTKLDNWFEELQYKYPDIRWKSAIQPSLTVVERVSFLYLCIYPHIRSAWEFVSLLYQMSYILRNGRWHSPSMHLAGVELVRATEEGEAGRKEEGEYVGGGDGSFTEKLNRLLRLSANTAAVCVSHSVSVSVFFLQFLDWWYMSDTQAPSLTALPIPQPPQPEKEREDSVPCGVCPLCTHPLTNSTALTVSGFVFCYPCIHQYIETHRCCPVTGYPSSEEHLVKIYQPDV